MLSVSFTLTVARGTPNSLTSWNRPSFLAHPVRRRKGWWFEGCSAAYLEALTYFNFLKKTCEQRVSCGRQKNKQHQSSQSFNFYPVCSHPSRSTKLTKKALAQCSKHGDCPFLTRLALALAPYPVFLSLLPFKNSFHWFPSPFMCTQFLQLSIHGWKKWACLGIPSSGERRGKIVYSVGRQAWPLALWIKDCFRKTFALNTEDTQVGFPPSHPLTLVQISFGRGKGGRKKNVRSEVFVLRTKGISPTFKVSQIPLAGLTMKKM